MDIAARVEILDEADCASQSANSLGKGMNPTIVLPAMGRLRFLALIWLPVKEKENSEIKPFKLRLKIGRVWYPAHAEGLGKHTCGLVPQLSKA